MTQPHTTRRTTIRAVALGSIALGSIALAAPLAGCRGERAEKPPRQLLPDMDQSPKWRPQDESAFYADGRTMRKPVVGTVSWGSRVTLSNEEREHLLREDDAFYRGTDGKDFLTHIPIPLTRELLLRGQNRFNIYCAACHGYTGEGNGMVSTRWSAIVPSFHDPKYADRTLLTGKDGYIFDVVRNGRWDTAEVLDGKPHHTGNQRMPSYAHALSEQDTWAVVAYVRALQATHTTDLGSLPADERDRLERSRAEHPTFNVPEEGAP